MKKFDLQLFAGDTVQGKQIVYLYRLLEDAATQDATCIAFVTEDELSASKDSETTVTKDGTIRTPGAVEIEKSGTSILAKGDTMYDKLRKAMFEDKIVEIWEANLAEPVEGGNNKFKGTYYQGYLTEFTKTSSSEEAVEIATTFGINGTGADGDVTVSELQQEMAAYVFADTQKTGA